MTKSKLYYGWVVAAACFVITLIGLGLANGTLSLYVKPICDDFGFSRGAYNLVYTITYIFQMIASLLFCNIYRRMGGIRAVFVIGISSICAAFTIFYLADNIYFFYGGAVFMGIGISYIATIPLSVIISNWFVAKRATILSFVFAGSGIGGIVLNPLVGEWITTAGWRGSYLYTLLLILIFLIPVIFILRGKPADIGLEPYGSHLPHAGEIEENEAETFESVPGKISKDPIFRLLIVAIFCFGIAVQPVYVNAAAHLGGVGLDLQVIAYIMSVLFISNTLSKILMGVIKDNYGIKPVILINNSLFVSAVLLLFFIRGANGLGFIFGIAFGVGYTITSITPPLLIATLFKAKDYENVIGIMMAAQTAGYAVGVPLMGLSFDFFGTYLYAFALAGILDIVGLVLVLRALKIKGETTAEPGAGKEVVLAPLAP